MVNELNEMTMLLRVQYNKIMREGRYYNNIISITEQCMANERYKQEVLWSHRLEITLSLGVV